MLDGIHDPGLREVVAFEGPWELRVADSTTAVSVQLLWPELGLSILLPSPLNPRVFDCALWSGHREKFRTWTDVHAGLWPVAHRLPSASELQSWLRWQVRGKAESLAARIAP
ncbi:MAG: hypothetical protein AAGE52_00515 [Myxococcota bacterium]